MDQLIPAIVQDSDTQKVLMLGYMNPESLKITQETGRVTFYSRSRQSLWTKGETSGNFLEVVDIQPDCDQDVLLIRARPVGPVCHRETPTCFESQFGFLDTLEATIRGRIESPSLDTPGSRPSYVATLCESGLDRVTQKVGEEAIETVIAAKNADIGAFENEAADLVFHLMVLLQYKKTSLSQVVQHLQERSKK